MKRYTGSRGFESCRAVGLAALLGLGPALPAAAQAPPAEETGEMRKARTLLRQARGLSTSQPGKAEQKRREALEQLERAWQVHKNPVALFRAALVFDQVFERPVAAAQAAERYLAAMEHRRMDVAGDEAAKRQVAAEAYVRAGRSAARAAEPDPQGGASCRQAMLRPVEGMLRIDDPTNQQFLLIREAQSGEVYTAMCDVDAVLAGQDDAGWALVWSGVGAVGAAAVLGGLGAYFRARDELDITVADDQRLAQNRDLVADEARADGLFLGAAITGAIGLGLIIGGAVWLAGGDDAVVEVPGVRPTVHLGPGGVPSGLGVEVAF